jgi:hypothetical protein
MKYMMLIYMNENAMDHQQREQCYVDSAKLTRDLHARGQYVAASPLQPISTATSVRVREGKRLVTDGPFAETHEQLGGFYIVDVKDLDEAISIAGRIPPASKGTVEIRPIMDIPGLPEGLYAQHNDLSGTDKRQLVCGCLRPNGQTSLSVPLGKLHEVSK